MIAWPRWVLSAVTVSASVVVKNAWKRQRQTAGLPVVAGLVEVGDAAHHQPALDLLGGLSGAECGESDLGDLGSGDPPVGGFVVASVGVFERSPGHNQRVSRGRKP
jgi:hypothetical protein